MGLIRFLVVIVYCDEVLRTSRDELRENSYFSFIKANSKFDGSWKRTAWYYVQVFKKSSTTFLWDQVSWYGFDWNRRKLHQRQFVSWLGFFFFRLFVFLMLFLPFLTEMVMKSSNAFVEWNRRGYTKYSVGGNWSRTKPPFCDSSVWGTSPFKENEIRSWRQRCWHDFLVASVSLGWDFCCPHWL